MKKLPIGIQSFRNLRENGALYIDKTQLIYQLVSQGQYYFLSRPRRFGKSLLLSTIEELFVGSKELFSGLWVENNWDWQEKYPVLRIDFSKLDYEGLGLNKAIRIGLMELAKNQGVTLYSSTIALQFKELIEKTSKTNKVVLLIDEYDKPITDYLTNLEKARENREILKNFYSIVKGSDPYIRFMLMTGVSKFSRTNIFSVLNHLQDISMHRDYATIGGYTQRELENNFEEYIETTSKELGFSKSKLLTQIKEWYNGYSWDGKTRLYNPFSILQFFSSRDFDNFWFESGTPTFLVNLLKREKIYDLDNTEVGSTAFNSYELENIGVFALLFQTGYLTVKTANRMTQIWTLGYPNKEVKNSFLQHLLATYTEVSYERSTPAVLQLKKTFSNNDITEVILIINTLFASIPNQLFQASSEAYFHSIVHVFFTYLGQYISSEVNTNRGRCDAIIETEKYIYALEFKLDKSAKEALKQIKSREYLLPFRLKNKDLFAIGINFSAAERKISDWVLEKQPQEKTKPGRISK